MELKEGDEIELTPGCRACLYIPTHFVCDNRKGDFSTCMFVYVRIGERHNGMDTDWLAGRYTVLKKDPAFYQLKRVIGPNDAPGQRAFTIRMPHDGVTVAEPSTTRQPSVVAEPSAIITR